MSEDITILDGLEQLELHLKQIQADIDVIRAAVRCWKEEEQRRLEPPKQPPDDSLHRERYVHLRKF